MDLKKKKQLLKQTKQTKMFTYEEAEKMAKDFANDSITSYIACSMIVLRDEFKFGKDRMHKFLSRESDHAKMMVEKRFSSDDVFKTIKDETNFDFYQFLSEMSAPKEDLQ